MVFESGPSGGPDPGSSGRADHGGGLLKRKPDIQSDSKNRKAKLTSPVTPKAQSAVAEYDPYLSQQRE